MNDDFICTACGGSTYSEEWEVLDWEFYTKGKKYKYCICSYCGSLVRKNKQVDERQIYNSKSYSALKMEDKRKEHRFTAKMKQMRDEYYYMGKHKLAGFLINKYRPAKFQQMKEYRNFFASGASFLDIGCGTGRMANTLKNAGVNAYAIEPYLDREIKYENGLVIEKKFVTDLKKQYDIVFLNMVLEHIEEPLKTLTAVYNILNKNGICGIVIPGFGSMTERYKENSYIIQAPQHVCIYSEKGVKKLVSDAGFRVIKLIKEPVRAWYMKSFLLQEGINFSESESESNLIRKLTIDLSSIENEMKKSLGGGDWYHIILRKNEKSFNTSELK